ncbi:copper resistance D family protein [Ensifer aridi]|uniref:copper resistance D family protein n=1 Tax=Ensifer aridi TaxID=1708715 RepID=UPI001552F13E|nr:CopD family protein [Ensifer aridi]
MTETIDWFTWTTKVALYIGFFVGVGGAFFVNWIGGRSAFASQVAASAMLLGLLAAPFSGGAQGLQVLMPGGLPALIALAAGLLSLNLKGYPGKGLSSLALIAVGVVLAAKNHASAAHPLWLIGPAVFLHGTGVAFWAGSLVPLATALAEWRADDTASTLHRFSQVAPFALLPLIAAGMLLALIRLQTLNALWLTTYGQVLLVKMALIAIVFALAVINRFGLTERAQLGDAAARRLLRRSIFAETALLLIILGIAAALRQLSAG